jgi:hypothetical protein
VTALLEFDSFVQVFGIVCLLAGAAAWGAAAPGGRASAWSRPVAPGILRRRRLASAAAVVLGAGLLVL